MEASPRLKKTVASILVILVLTVAAIIYFALTGRADTIDIPNGDLLEVTGNAWTNGNVKGTMQGYATVIAIGGNTADGINIPQIPALEIADPQAIDGYGPGCYIFTQDDEIGGNGVNMAWVNHFLPNYTFRITDLTHPSDSPTGVWYAGSDVYELSGYSALSNPYNNPYYYASGQYVHLYPYNKPSVSVTNVTGD